MPLSRLENFLKNAEGNILYVNPSDFDATDSFENRGNSLTRPFRTIQRALIEAARFSYQVGRNNDKIDSTTVLVYPGTHYIDNRPGHSIQASGGAAVFKKKSYGSWTTSGAIITEFTENSNFDIFDEDNDLVKFNSVEGGVILPRGTSIVGLDLRKTKIRPLYIPDPENPSILPSSLFRVTGTCYFTAFSFFDGDTNRPAYKDDTVIKVSPTFSHHKLSCFEYCDGLNRAKLGTETADLTDLQMFYYKVTHAYGDTSGRGLADFPAAASNDFEPSIDEYRIVGDLRADSIGISSIKSGDGNITSQVITVTTEVPHGLYANTPILVSGITTNISVYNGSFLVTNVINDNQFTYTAPSAPTNPLPPLASFVNSEIIVESDSVSSASPYVFSCTLRSVYGMNGLHADGSKATGFKSMLTAQFTGISLQKDDNAFIVFDEQTGIYNDNLTAPESAKPLHTNSRAIFKPTYENFHMKCSNDSIIQCVSIFAIGFAKHFVADSGGDQSITNSNSNFGAIALESSGFQANSFDRDDVGYITHIIPVREPLSRTSAVSWLALDATKIVSVANTERLYIANYNSIDIPPPSQVDSYRIGARKGDELYLSVIIGNDQKQFKSPILMPVPSGIGTSSQKIYEVGRQVGINSISNDIVTLTQAHQLFNGEKIRLYSDNGNMPTNIENNKVYYAITTGLNPNQIKISATFNDANANNNITGISNGGGSLQVISSVSDKFPAEAGHPMQYDTTEKQWYILGSKALFFNTIYDGIVGIGTSIIGDKTGATFVLRQVDNRGIEDRLYKVRYVIPKEFQNARDPSDGFILQETKTTGIGSASFINATVEDPTQFRNPKVIIGATYNGGVVNIKTELPHNLVPGDKVTIRNIISSNNLTKDGSLPYNGLFVVNQTPTPKEFSYVGISSDPGIFLNQTNQRTTQQQIENLPTIQRQKYRDSLFIYRNTTIKKHIPGPDGQDGIYLLTLLAGSVSPDKNVGFGLSEKRFNQDIRNLYPQQDRDNYNSDPSPAISHAKLSPLGVVNTNDKRNSVTKEALNIFFDNNRVGYAVTGAIISGAGNTTITLFTNQEHNLNQIIGLTLTNPGAGYNNSAGISSVLFSADLNSATIAGRNASVKATISVGNTITSIQIVDGGSAYGVGNTMTINPSPGATPSAFAVVQVSAISNNVGDTLELSGFVEDSYNGIFKIIEVPSTKSIKIYNPTGVGFTYRPRNDNRFPLATLASKGIKVGSINYNIAAGIATVSCTESHGLLPGNTFKLSGIGTTATQFDNKFIVNEIIGVTTFTFNAGITTIPQSLPVGGITAHKFGFSANAKALGSGEENLGGRGSYIYAGITTNLAANISITDTNITLVSSNGLSKGDYLCINSEIVRIIAQPVTSTITVIRGQFSTIAAPAEAGIPVKKIRVLPMEIRRHSILRASGHTFEYLGFGPGNYSTGLPLKQDRVLSDDEVLVSQAREIDGGTVVYTGMNDRGEFFSGATKIKGASGEEEVIEAPIITYYGDDAQSETLAKNSGVFDDLVVKERITVEGGENNNQTSQFYGPVNFSEKLTNTSENGLETRDLYIKGVASQPKLFTVGISTPIDPKKSGDMIWLSTPDPGYSKIGNSIFPGGYLGWVFSDSDWRRFGLISRYKNSTAVSVDQLSIGKSEGVYDWQQALCVNGDVRIKDLYVGGQVTFASNQTFSGVTYDDITVNNQILYVGSGSSNYTIKHQNANSVAQFQRMEVTGTAATFSSNTQVTFGNAFISVHAGVSTIQGTLKVGNLECNSGVVSVTKLIAKDGFVDYIGVKTAHIGNGIVTSLRDGTASNLIITPSLDPTPAGSGIVTFYTGIFNQVAIGTIKGTLIDSPDYTGERIAVSKGYFNNYLTVGAAGTMQIPIGIVTQISGHSIATYTTAKLGIATITDLTVTDRIVANLSAVNVGIATTVRARSFWGPLDGTSSEIKVTSGIITSLKGYNSAASPVVIGGSIDYQDAIIGRYLNVYGSFASGFGLHATGGICTNFGHFENFGAGNNVDGKPKMPTQTTAKNMNIHCGSVGEVYASRFTSFVTGDKGGTGVSPFVVSSSLLVTNLNANYLQGKIQDTAKSNNTIVCRDNAGSIFAQDVNSTGSFKGNLQHSIGVSSPLTITANEAFNNSANRTISINSSSNVKNNTGYVVQADTNGDFTARHITADNFYGIFNGTTAGSSGNFAGKVEVNTGAGAGGGVNGGDALVIQKGGDLRIYSTNNTYNAVLYCDSSAQLNLTGKFVASGDVTAFSDIRLKKDIEKINNALDKIQKLSGFTYKFNKTAVEVLGEGYEYKKRHAGVSAQQVQQVLPEAIDKTDNGYLMVKYDRLIPLLIEGIKELKDEVTELRAELDELKGTK